ncbi:sulfatase [Luteitalea sp.]|jgi:arylsulfatase A|uniref:sulfatase n=1 Tax=Luteitalea sp. TaxID=2004800 RepID=UPI0037C58389
MRTSRRDFTLALCAGAAMGARPRGVHGQPADRPSFVVFLSDDLGYGDLGCYGHPINRTPHLDRFATEGMRFTDGHAASTVCSPSRAALLTGRHPYRLGIYYLLENGVHLRRQEVTIASLVRRQGYDTCFVGKWHVSRLGESSGGQPTPQDHGFDHWFATEHNAFDGPENPGRFFRNGAPVGPVTGWYCDVIVEEALAWLRRRPNPSRPFLLFVNSHEPHTPVRPPDRYSAAYDTEQVDGLERSVAYGGEARPAASGTAHLKKHYYGTITQLDAAFGTLMQGLDDLGLRERTLALFTSDNGPETPITPQEEAGVGDPLRDRSFGTPGPLRGVKRYVYEGGHRIPLIVRWPGRVRAGAVSHHLVNGTDLLPTLAALAAAPLPGERTIDGVDVSPVLAGGSVTRPIPACWTFPARYHHLPHIAMREGDHSLVGWMVAKRPDQRWMGWIKTTTLERSELYDLRNDIGQRHDLARQDPERHDRLRRQLIELWAGIQADAPVWEEWLGR